MSRLATASRRPGIRPVLVLVLVLCLPRVAGASEVEDLRRENAWLKSEVQSLQAQLDALRGASAQGTGTPARAADGAPEGTRLEPVFIPRSRISIEVGRDQVSGNTTLATLWYRTADAGLLPRKEWFQLRAEQAPGGELRGPWMLVERQGAGAGAKVESGTLTVDGSVIELPVVDYDAKMKSQTIGPISSSSRNERIRFSLPASALPLVANARTVRFQAGGIDFELTDEHLAAFAAMAARLAPAPAQPAAR